MLRHTSAGIDLDKKAAYEQNPEIFKTKNVGNVWEMAFNSGKTNTGFGRKETKSKWGHSGFPLQLPETCILLSTKPGDMVLDLFMGSGTTGVACKKLDRNFVGIELNKNYFDIAKERIEKEEK
jgi:site-specific DNA-methyltransferase (adenine-specific)